jgi:diguanylate cyclase (GGDEF)-like protein
MSDSPAVFTTRVLVVEDDPVTQKILAHILASRGHVCTLCGSAEAALEEMQREFYPLIILDLMLPGMNGLEFSRRLRAEPDGDRYYILLSTANNRPQDLQEILAAGADDYMAKPYQPAILNVRLAVAEQQVRQVAARKQLEHQLKEMALIDPLTKLLNRSQLEVEIEKAVELARQGMPGAVLYIDLDNFKIVNDSLGHTSGDRLLVNVAQLLRNNTRPQDAIIRFGGDEFVVVCPQMPFDEGCTAANRLHACLDEFRFTEGGGSFRLGASIGIAPVDGTLNSGEVLTAADSACYSAKARGRGRVEVYHPEQSEMARLISDTNWASAIQEAMRLNELRLWFQPILTIQTRKTYYEEVLVRYYNDEQQQFVSPNAFLSAVARSGQSIALDRYILTHSLQTLAIHRNLVLGVNLSGQTLNDADLSRFIREEARRAGIEPKRLILEITEDTVISNLEQARAMIRDLQKDGFRFALDDFGVGFSSLAYLKNLPVNILKIDGSFVRDLATEPLNKILIRSVQEVGKLLHLTTVAEFVENEKTLQLLEALGIDCAQGFYFSPAQPEPLFLDKATATR